MSISVRVASLDDVKGIVNVHCSGIERWVRRVDGKEVEVTYDELTVEERWAHGGPWMTVETCSVHVNYMLVHGQYPLVAELEGKIVGSLDLYIGEEMGVLGKTAFIDVLEVHKGYRRRGIGKCLVRRAMEIARDNGCDTIAVWPVKDAIDFYKKCGIKDVAYEIIDVEIDVQKFLEIENFEYHEIKSLPEYDVLKSMNFISPRIFSSFTAWLKSRWKYAVAQYKMVQVEGWLPRMKIAYIIENLWSTRDKARVYLWIEDVDYMENALRFVLNIAKRSGFKKLRFLVSDEFYDRFLRGYPHEIVGREVLLMSKV